MTIPFTEHFFVHLVETLSDQGFGNEVLWSENAQPPVDPEDLASEAIFVICNGGMKNTVARGIYERVMPAITGGASAATVFKNANKVKAIDQIWRTRAGLFAAFQALPDDDSRLAWCGSLPHIGPITKYHLAKNFGVDVAKPDVHLQRLADLHGETVQGLCQRLGGLVGLRARTVDVVLWRACAAGVLNSRTGELR